MISHVSRNEREEKLHISHLHHYVSAYETNAGAVTVLVTSIEEAIEKAKRTKEIQVVDQEGECCFHVYPSGNITLMLPWKKYKIIKEE